MILGVFLTTSCLTVVPIEVESFKTYHFKGLTEEEMLNQAAKQINELVNHIDKLTLQIVEADGRRIKIIDLRGKGNERKKD